MAFLARSARLGLFGGSAAAAGLLANSGVRPFSLSAASPSSLHDFTVKNIDGEQVDLSRYAGRVCVVVNVASK